MDLKAATRKAPGALGHRQLRRYMVEVTSNKLRQIRSTQLNSNANGSNLTITEPINRMECEDILTTEYLNTGIGEQQLCTTSCQSIDNGEPAVTEISCQSKIQEDYHNKQHFNDETDFQSLLANWIVQFNIPHTAINHLLPVLQKIIPSLPLNVRTLLNTPRSGNHQITPLAPGRYCHLGIENSILDLFKLHGVQEFEGHLKLNLNIDGLPLTKSKSNQFWPILMSIKNMVFKDPFAVGIYSGLTKPHSSNELLRSFVDEWKLLSRKGIHVGKFNLTLSLNAIICDAPAKAFVLCVKGHQSYSGCNKCCQEGVLQSNHMTYPDSTAVLRKDDDFARGLYEDYQKEKTILLEIDNFGLVSQVPLDYMHLICLGVTKRLLKFFVQGAKDVRFNQSQLAEIDAKIVRLRDYIPSEFVRLPRSILEIDRWKATELRLFVFYIGPELLKLYLSSSKYKHFLTLHTAVRILACKSLCFKYNQYAKELLLYFVNKYGDLYGHEFITYNVHNLIHIADDVLQFGPLDEFSAFPYENYLGKIKKSLKECGRPLEQFLNRLAEYKSNRINDIGTSFPVLRGEHNEGPSMPHLTNATQFQILEDKAFTLCIKKNGTIVLF